MSKIKEWTLMFYFASDNPLAPGIISQLKTIKQAGFHPQANVIAQFDPHPVGAPTHIFEVNLTNKLKNPDNAQIGYTGLTSNDPFVPNLLEDKLWRKNQQNRYGNPIRLQFKDFIEKLIKGKLEKAYKKANDKQRKEAEALGLRGEIVSDLPEPPYDKVVYNPPEPPPYKEQENKPVAGDNSERLILADQHSDSNENGNSDENGNLNELGPKESLAYFLEFCRKNYEAQHYILFILGHGMVVGNDIFLFDEHADKHSLSLLELHSVLDGFKSKIGKSQLELVSFHSCSVSSAEVVCQLKGTANYMLASQGPAFVASWPYRQILMRIFNDIDNLKKLREAKNISEHRQQIKKMLQRICRYCYHNSTDFLLAGYSFDICLCDLNKADDIIEPVRSLSEVLITALDDPLVRDLILLAHWRSQSYWQENYSDITDFCLCLSDLCESLGDAPPQKQKLLDYIIQACSKVIFALTKEGDSGSGIPKSCSNVTTAPAKEEKKRVDKLIEEKKRVDKLIVEADVAGPAYQYSHGLSVFFPWSQPSDDADLLVQYKDYEFAKKTGWFDFLTEAYFEKTRRKTRRREEATRGKNENGASGILDNECDEQLREDLASLVYNEEGELSPENALTGGGGKVNPPDPTGDDCVCHPIKNFPRDTRALREREGKAAPTDTAMPVTQGSFKVP